MKTALFVEIKTVYRCLVGTETFNVQGDSSRRPGIRCPKCQTHEIELVSVVTVFDCHRCDDEIVVPGDARGERVICRDCGAIQDGGYSTPRLVPRLTGVSQTA